MLCVETIDKIRRRRLVDGESISAVARDLALARNMVKRALRIEGEAYECRRVRQPWPKLGAHLETLESWLEAEEKLRARERSTAQLRLCEALCLEGYTGAVDAVRRHQRSFERRRHPIATAFILRMERLFELGAEGSQQQATPIMKGPRRRAKQKKPNGFPKHAVDLDA